ncbi:MAG TPA: hypothetical protein VN345_02160 [Blastocatellia bacterium]|jgi:hypothetical protein|nr:hypothetical protein [Blastocatellia bacterium]
MRARLLVAVLLFMAVLPVLSPSDIKNAVNPTGLTALAGHQLGGSYCEDGTPGCLPGDPPLTRSARQVAGMPVTAKPTSNSGSMARIIALNLLRWIVGTF